jgi:hypothetical protein
MQNVTQVTRVAAVLISGFVCALQLPAARTFTIVQRERERRNSLPIWLLSQELYPAHRTQMRVATTPSSTASDPCMFKASSAGCCASKVTSLQFVPLCLMQGYQYTLHMPTLERACFSKSISAAFAFVV